MWRNTTPPRLFRQLCVLLLSALGTAQSLQLTAHLRARNRPHKRRHDIIEQAIALNLRQKAWGVTSYHLAHATQTACTVIVLRTTYRPEGPIMKTTLSQEELHSLEFFDTL